MNKIEHLNNESCLDLVSVVKKQNEGLMDQIKKLLDYRHGQ